MSGSNNAPSGAPNFDSVTVQDANGNSIDVATNIAANKAAAAAAAATATSAASAAAAAQTTAAAAGSAAASAQSTANQAATAAAAAQTAAAGALTPQSDLTNSPVTFGGSKTTLGTALTAAAESGSGGSGSAYVLPVATSSTLGGIKAGAGLTIAADGTASVTGGGSGSSVPALTHGSIVQPTGIRTDVGLKNPVNAIDLPAFGPLTASPGYHIIVDPSRTYQKMLGVGAALTEAAAYCLMTYLTKTQRTAFFTEMFVTNGCRMIRLCMGSSDYACEPFASYDDNGGVADLTLDNFSIERDTKYVIPMLLEILAIQPGLFIFAAPWTPPAWLKSSGGTLISGTMNATAANLKCYAQYFVKFIQAYAEYGITINAVTAQNEPQVNNNLYPSCGWAAADLATFNGTYLGPALAYAYLTDVEIWAGDTSWGSQNTYLPQILGTNPSGLWCSAAAYHGYNGYSLEEVTEMVNYPGKELHLTEWITATTTSNQTNINNMCGEVAVNIIRFGASSATLWNLALDQHGAPYLGAPDTPSNCRGVVTIQNDGSGKITRNVEYYMFTHLARFMQPGCYRCASNTFGFINDTTTDIETNAFVNPDGSRFVYIWNPTSVSKTVTITDAVTQQSTVETLAAGDMVTVFWEAGATVAPGTFVAPGVATSVAATSADGINTITWAAPASVGSTALGGNIIMRGTATGALTQLSVAPASALSFADATGVAGTEYYYSVIPFGGGGQSTGTAETVSVTTSQETVASFTTYATSLSSTTAISGSPVTLTVTPGSGAALASDAVITPASTLAGAFSPTTMTIPAGSTSAVTCTFTPSASGTATISTTNNASLTDPASLSLTVSSAATAPGAPSFTLDAGDGKVVVSVTAPSSNGGSAITGYPIYTGSSAGGEATTPVTTLTAAGSYTLTGLTNGTPVYVKVGATNAIGTTVAAEQSATPAAASAPAHYLSVTGYNPNVATKLSADMSGGYVDIRAWVNATNTSTTSSLVFGDYRTASANLKTSSVGLLITTNNSIAVQLVDTTGKSTSYDSLTDASGANIASANPSATTGIWIRAVVNASASANIDNLQVSHPANSVSFWTSLDGTTWTQLGVTQTYTGTGILTPATNAYYIISDPHNGISGSKIYKAVAYDNAGNVIANPDFTLEATGATSFVDTAGIPNTWSVSGNATIV